MTAATGTLDRLPAAVRPDEGLIPTFVQGYPGALHDDHLTAVTHNVAHGREPLTSFLDRYVLGPKTAHARQLHTAIDEL